MRISAMTLVLMTLTLPGCAAITALQGEPERDLYELRAPDNLPTGCRRGSGGEVVVEPPKARGTLDSNRVMIRPTPLQAQYLPDAEWGDTVPNMLQRLLVESLGRTGGFAHVGPAPLGVSGDHALVSDIRDFNAEVSGDAAIVRLSVDAQLVREMDASVVSRGTFSAASPAASTKTQDLILAFDAAGQQLVLQMTDWALRATGARNSCN